MVFSATRLPMIVTLFFLRTCRDFALSLLICLAFWIDMLQYMIVQIVKPVNLKKSNFNKLNYDQRAFKMYHLCTFALPTMKSACNEDTEIKIT